MSGGDTCLEMHLLIQADLDGELSPAEAARVAAHVDACPGCAALQTRMLALSSRLHREAPRHAAPADLRRTIMALGRPAPVISRRLRAPSWAFGAGFALAACLAWLLILPGGATLEGDLVSSHIRALQPGHLTDVVSSDQHTVKPWFDGRLPYAPPVKDLAAHGFPLAGARLDVLGSRPVAVLVYRHRQHAIDLFVVPEPGVSGPKSSQTSMRDGYTVMQFSDNGMTLWAVSDVAPADLAEFVRLWRGG